MKRWLLKLLKVEEQPSPPPGSRATLEVFHPSRRFLHYTALGWAVKQLSGFVGIVLPIVLLGDLTTRWIGGVGEALHEASAELPFDVGAVLLGLLFSLESLAVLVYLVQLVVTGMMLELGWRMRWYMVSDESLRIREGLVRVREQTLRVANIQNMVLRQGPLQRLLGISDLEVHTAGGGRRKGSSETEAAKEKTSHVGRFRGLDDGEALRDRLQRALARYRGAGLGERSRAVAPVSRPERSLDADPAVASALGELLDEARRLRRQLESGLVG